MTCRHCGTEIADTALICYKCGTATTDAKYQPAAPPRRGSSLLIASIAAVAVLAATASFVGRTTGGTPRLFTWIVVAIAVVIVGLRAYARRR